MRKYKHRNRRRNKNQKIIIITSICLLFIMSAGYAAFSTNINITAKGNILKQDRIIQSWSRTSTEDFHADYYRKNIVSATLLNNNNVPDNATESWNISEDKSKGGVMAWVVPSTKDSTKYDLYIGANGGVIANEDSSFLFYNFTNLMSIEFDNNFDTSNASRFSWTFGNCEKLIELDLSNFNTEKATYMGFTFRGCTNLIKLNISNFNTKNVKDMRNMFYGCNNLKELDLSNFNTENVTSMNAMFLGCYSLEKLNISNFITSRVTDMFDMFSNCKKLTTLDLSHFDTTNVTNMGQMFNHMTSLTTLNICSFDTSKVTNMQYMFQGTSNLSYVYVGSNWITANAITTNMFNGSGVSGVTTGQC